MESGTQSTRWPDNVAVLSDGIVTLRAHADTDLDRVVELATDVETVRWTPMPSPYTRSDAELFINTVVRPGWDDGVFRNWIIEVDGAAAGTVGLRGGGVLADIGYMLHPAVRGHGFSRRAICLALGYGFAHTDIQVVRWVAREGNIASLKAAHASGFTFHARVPDDLEVRGEIWTTWHGSIHRGDVLAPTRPWGDLPFPLEW
ncbi:MAG: GNAT family N-acetyltransferase [Gordonia sp. (in: high G+C Gram-positive bacteria)]